MSIKAKWTTISLVIIFTGVFIATLVGTNFGQTNIKRLKFVDEDGYYMSATLYIPKTATSENPAPAMIVVPGGDSSADAMSPWSDELSRRGYVVMAVDYSGAGDTEVNPKKEYFRGGGSMGLDAAYDFIAKLDFVDSGKIGVGGHSMGSLYSYRLSLQRKVRFVISNVIYRDALPDYNFNFIQISGTHDEGILARINTFDDIYRYDFLCGLFGTEEIVPNQIYGSWRNNNTRVLYPIEGRTHNDLMISGRFIGQMLYSVMQSVTAPNPIPESNLIYPWKIFGLFIAVVGMGMFLFNLAGLLLETDMFRKLILANNKRVPGFAYKSGGWWIYAILLALVPLIMFFPGTSVGNKMPPNALFMLGSTPNGYLVWSLFSAILMIALFLFFHFTTGRKQGGSLSSYGYSTVENQNKISISHIGRAALFSLVLFLSVYFLLYVIVHFAKTDLHIWTVSIRPFNDARAGTYPWYYLGLAPYFCASMLTGNILNYGNEDDSKGPALRKSVIIGTLIGICSLLALFIFHQIWLRISPYGAFYTGSFAHFYMTTLEALLPQFGFATALALYINKKTKSNFAGLFIGVALVTFFMVSNNALALVV